MRGILEWNPVLTLRVYLRGGDRLDLIRDEIA